MPIPRPKPKETRNQFVQRCVKDSTMKKEYPIKQRLAICHKQWERAETR